MVLLGVAVVAAVIAPVALAHPYTASISKTGAGTGDADPYTYTITNNYSAQKATKAEITIPTGWAVSGLTATASDGSWGAPTVTSGKIVVAATSGGLGFNKALHISFTGKAGTPGAGICSGGTSTWTPKVSNGPTLFSLTGSVPKVTVTKPGRLAAFAWSVQPGAAQTAGVAFTVATTASDGCGNVKTNYVGPGALTGTLGTSAKPLPAGMAPVYALSAPGWSSGSAFWSVTAFKADTGRSLTITDGAVSKLSDPFAVSPGPLNLTFSAFTPSPGLAKLAIPVSRVAGTSASLTPVTVSAEDPWGNLAPNGTPVTVDLSSPVPVSGQLTGTTLGTTSAGVASFDNLNVSPVANGYAFTATATGGAGTATSGLFNVSNDVAVCSGATCSNSASLPSGQTASTALTAGGGGGFNGEFLQTTFSTDPLNAPPGACDGFTPVGSGGEISVAGGSPTASQPTFLITLKVPAALLDPHTAAWRYDVCLGAKSFVQPAVPWKTKKLASLFTRKSAVPDGSPTDPNTRYWGLVPRCFWVVDDPFEAFFNFLPIPTTNPCIVSKSRPVTGSGLGDLTIVLRKPYPWDARFSTGN